MEVEQNNNLKNLELFFLRNSRIKYALAKLSPMEFDYKDPYGYYETLVEKLDDIKQDFQLMLNNFDNNQNLESEIDNFFAKINNNLPKNNFSYKELQEFYDKSICDMNKDLLKDIGTNFFGHYLYRPDVESYVSRCNSVNELLHLFHSVVVNNENYYRNIPIVASKNIDELSKVNLRGKQTEIATRIYENFPLGVDCGNTDILSLKTSEKIIMMTRDKGHALTIEIDLSDKKDIYINYFIPKICNVEMVNMLKGVHKVDSSSNFTTGCIRTNENSLILDLNDFISKVPTDKDDFFVSRYRGL